MDESLKRRLVGATVLVSLIVIFVPMLLEDESGQPPEIKGSNIPPRPAQDSGFGSSRILPLEDEPPSSPRGVPDLPQPEAVGPVADDRAPVWQDAPETEGAPEREAEPELVDQPFPPTPQSDSLPSAQEEGVLPAEQVSVVAPSQSRRPEPQEIEPAPRRETPRPIKAPTVPPGAQPRAAARPEPSPAKPSTTAWVVQVGSFSDRSNADRLVQELRAARYSAFQEQTEVGGSTLYRVRVGPEEDRDLANAIAAGIAKRFKLNGRVVSYP